MSGGNFKVSWLSPAAQTPWDAINASSINLLAAELPSQLQILQV
jgi:hypothetical protein